MLQHGQQHSTTQHMLRCNNDSFQDGSIEFDEFIRALSITSRGNLDEKLSCKWSGKIQQWWGKATWESSGILFL